MAAPLYTCTAILIAVLAFWVRVVDQTVPQPYLDEVFHVPQAQQYCAGHWKSWDPKITTPPGLYFFASTLSPLVGCSTSILRVENAVCLIILVFSLFSLQLDSEIAEQTTRNKASPWRWTTTHTAVNIVLFPPLFFFAALYYTDVPSTLSVVLFLNAIKPQALQNIPRSVRLLVLSSLGMSTLLFRQTNVFWVAIFPAAITAVQTLDRAHFVVKDSMHNGTSGFGDSWASLIKTSWKMRVMYNPSIRDATFEDYLKCVATVVTGIARAATNLPMLGELLIALCPFIAILLSFLAFIIWNGSVVLGDKSNHVATLHLPQMLYIWPYFLLFSWPVLIPHLVGVASRILARLPLASAIPFVHFHKDDLKLPRLRYVVLSTAVASTIIYLNTIIHPFTLADNRHYTFYVFRLLMRPWWVRYAVVPVYALGAWLCIQAYGSVEPHSKARPLQRATNTTNSKAQLHHVEPTVAFVIIWLVTTSLQLITAPLVEPRYFILPWLIWRLNIPKQRRSGHERHLNAARDSWLGSAIQMSVQQRLWLETIWYIIVNAVTGYIFLYWEFRWPSEPGNIQRFMW